ncbi:MAG: FAD-dependent oxidoreductase, partial [Planctomycetes bacterium]|nr:FAD-dependent oxidoreductase [Planctomycetota bacterium]
MTVIARLVFAIVLFVSTIARADSPPTYDIVVYGGTSSGIAAAVQAVRMGKSVVVIEPGKHLGGLTSGGLGWTDSGNKTVIGGISREFYQRVKKHYDQPAAWKFQKPQEYSRYRPTDDAQWTFEPHRAEHVHINW